MDDFPSDIIWGADAIAAFCNTTRRRVYHWVDKRSKGHPAPPIANDGRMIYALRSQLRAYFAAGAAVGVVGVAA